MKNHGHQAMERVVARCYPPQSMLEQARAVPPVHAGEVPSICETPEFSQIETNALFVSASSKQNRVPWTPRSIHQSILFALEMRDASPRN